MGLVNKLVFSGIALAIILLFEIPSLTSQADAVTQDVMNAQDSLQEVIDEVNNLTKSRELNFRRANLPGLLDQVKNPLNNEDCRSAIAKLKNFEFMVEFIMKIRRLSPEAGDKLLGLASNVNSSCKLEIGFVPGEVIIQFKAGTSQADMDNLITLCNTSVRKSYNLFLDNFETPIPPDLDARFRNLYVLSIKGSATEPNTQNCFSSQPALVESSDLNLVARNASHMSNNWPNDPEFLVGSQWPLINGGQNSLSVLTATSRSLGSHGLIDADIDVVQAWDLPHTDCSVDANGDPMIIAIIDTGVYQNHPDLAANLWTNPGNPNAVPPILPEIPGNGVDDDKNGYIDDIHGWDFMDDRFRGDPLGPRPLKREDRNGDGPEAADPSIVFMADHGAFNAGIIGAVGNNGIGISGICQKAQLMILRDAIGESVDWEDTLDAAFYITRMKSPPYNHNIRVVNISQNSECKLGFCGKGDNVYVELNDPKILVVNSAGNERMDLDARFFEYVPCTISNRPSNVMCVASTNEVGCLDVNNRGTNWGKLSVDLAAPGDNIVSLTHPTAIVTDKDGRIQGGAGLRVWGGSSMAAPHAAGVAALAFSLFPGKTALQVKTDLMSGSVGSPFAASGVDISNFGPCARPTKGNLISDGTVRWPYTADLGDAPASYLTIATGQGAIHWDIGNEYFGDDVTPEVDANTPPPLDQDPKSNIFPKVDFDGADHPMIPGNGQFIFDPVPPWGGGQPVAVSYQICSDHAGVKDAAGGRYLPSDPDRAMYVNAWFDMNRDGAFDPTELFLTDIIDVLPAPPPNAKPENPNVQINVPGTNPTFPPPLTSFPPRANSVGQFMPLQTCYQVSSSYLHLRQNLI